MQIRRPNIDRLGAAKNRRAPATRWKTQPRRERGRPRPQQPDDRWYTGFDDANPAPEHSPAGVRRRIAALPQSVGESNGAGSAAVSAAIIRRPIGRPVSIIEIRRPKTHRLRAGKNARAPAGRWKRKRRRERGRLGRNNPVIGRTPVSIRQIRRLNIHLLGCGEESPRSDKSAMRLWVL
ncbi:MAG TPA: hypothetical protein PLW35_00225 [Verrucomicrobiota bacterium]|nr:hypothetical protein [Verrucomicrobiota bacterium]